MRRRSTFGDLGKDGVDFGPNAGLQLAADQGPLAQDIEGIMGAQEGVHSASVDSQRGSCAPFGDPRALLF